MRASSGNFGDCAAIPELAGVPIVAMIGDSHAALVGHGRYEPGTVKATYGTGSSLMMLTPELGDGSETVWRAPSRGRVQAARTLRSKATSP